MADKKPNVWASKPDLVPAYDAGAYIYKSVDADDWDKYYPYQLLILEARPDGTYKTTPWRFTLPIPPEDLSISMPTADTLQATLTGVVEVSGGAPFRNIVASGTTGIWPDRESVHGGALVGGSSFVSTALAPIASGISELVSGLPPRTKNEAGTTSFPTAMTGFYKFHQLKTFLESYLAMRARGKSIKRGDSDKRGENYIGPELRPENLRLAFAMWKDSSVYLVRLHQFDMRRHAGDPMGYSYSLQMQAFKRVDLEVRGEARTDHKIVIKKGALSGLLDITNRMNAVRKILAASKRLVSLGTLGPLTFVGEIARQVSGATKDLLGVARAIVDMPASFVRGALSTALEVSQDVGSGIRGVNQAVIDFNKLPERIRDQLGISQGKKVVRLSGVMTWPTGGTTQGPVEGRGSQPATHDTETDGRPAQNNTGIDPDDLLAEAPEIGDVKVEELPLTDEQRAQLRAEIEASLALTIADFERWRRQVQESLDAFVRLIGCWDDTYNDTYGLPTGGAAQRDPTQDELDAMFAINNLEQSLDELVVYMRGRGGNAVQQPNSLEYVAGLAAASGVAFRVPRSKFGIPFPYGASLERLALEYLGSPDRWHEIAVLNNLRAPYVDEVGFALPLLVNGSGQEIVVSDASNLYLGQSVVMTSNTQRPTAMKIIALDVEAPGQVVVVLDKAVDAYTTYDQANLRAFLPGTINSRQIIYIPSQGDPAPSAEIDSIPGVDLNDPLVRMGGVDLLLTPQLDLVVTPWGDNPLAIGLTNMNQQANIALNTVPGALMDHPFWGFNARVGSSMADVDVATIIGNLRTLFNADFDFAGVKSASIFKQGNRMSISAQIGVNGYNRDVPLLLSLGAGTR